MPGVSKVKCAVIGSGNIGTDLMIKILRAARHLEVAALVGIDPGSDGLARARRLGVTATRGTRALRRDRRLHCFEVRRSRHARQH